MQKVSGNLKGLSPSELKFVHKLFNRKCDPESIATLDLARELYSIAESLSRRVGILVSREGNIEEVFVGSKDILYLPELGRYRLGKGRLRKLRLIYSDLSSNSQEPSIPADIIADLEKLRLDMVVSVKNFNNRTAIKYMHIQPGKNVEKTYSEQINNLALLDINFLDLIDSIENQIESEIESTITTDAPSAVLISVTDKKLIDVETSLNELEELARTGGVNIIDRIIQRKKPDPKSVLGKGKLEEVVLHCLRIGADILIFDSELKPGQWRVITNSTELKVLDRSMLILDIFAQRATSSEGRLQVELAQLKYNAPKLADLDSGLSRLTGGIGGRGPGETKLEIGRRRLKERISELEKKIEIIKKQRGVRKQRRKINDIPLVSILGYTNVGKSTLFNILTGSSVIAENKLFATLDPSQRNLKLFQENVQEDSSIEVLSNEMVLSDTVGFIRDLPEELFNAFRATLEELYDSKLLIHVLDASDKDVDTKKEAVEKILKTMDLTNTKTIIVLNKIDLISREALDVLINNYDAIAVSAVKKIGLTELKKCIYDNLFIDIQAPI